MPTPDFETRQSASVLPDIADKAPDDALMLSAPSTVDAIVRAYMKRVIDGYGEAAGGSLSAEDYEQDIRAEAKRIQAVFYGAEPDVYVHTAWHAPSQIGRHILTFGPVADDEAEAVYGLLGVLATDTLKLIAGMPEEGDDAGWQSEADALIENYSMILLGHPPQPG